MNGYGAHMKRCYEIVLAWMASELVKELLRMPNVPSRKTTPGHRVHIVLAHP